MLLNKKSIKLIAILFIIAGLVVSLVLNVYRIKVENEYKSVEILVDYEQLKSLSSANDMPLKTIAERFKVSGATGVVVRERNFQSLVSCGDILLLGGKDLAFQQKVDENYFQGFIPKAEKSYIIVADKALFEEIYESLEMKKDNITVDHYKDLNIIGLSLTSMEVANLGVGFSKEDLQEIAEVGLTVIPRLRTWEHADQESIDGLTEYLKDMQGLSMVTFNDVTLPGDIGYLAHKFTELEVPLGTFEFYSQSGLNNLALLMEKNVVRIHVISENDLKRYDENSALNRFKLAVSERNIRAIYVRMFEMEKPATALEKGAAFVAEVKKGVQEEGFKIEAVKKISSIPYSRYFIFAIGLAVLGGVILFLNQLMIPLWTTVLGVFGLLGWMGLLYIEPLLARKAFALLAVIIFPILAVIYLVRDSKRDIKGTIVAFLLMSGISMSGAIIMTGLLADKSFALKLDQFSGVKLAHIMPLLIVPLYFFFKGGVKNSISKVHKMLRSSVQVWHILAGAFIVIVLGVYIIRTGNSMPELVSPWENKLRDILDSLLVVRPRTKEFLIGHPIMMLMLYYGYSHRKLPLLVLGIIGQISLVNTYAHIHTPLAISLLRSFHGLWLGMLLGILAIVLVQISLKWLTGRLSDG
ncbi:MAG: DUF5693 family protein [Clostridia bacterium]|nr:DUF5693 family protein [Clostridia bacterium]MDD4047321.1 DUF5693 family protein [Clostridia bacterium]